MKKQFLIILALVFTILISSCSSSEGVRDDSSSFETGTYKGNLEKFFQRYENAVHKLGAEGPNAFDCSGFVQKAYNEVYGIKLPRTSGSQYLKGTRIKKVGQLEYGDLVFFNTSGRGVSHVGIYVGRNEFIHVSSTLGVTRTDINTDYYKKRFIEGRRLLK